MSVKLIVYQIPPTLTNEEFTASFRDLKGFLDARLTYNEKINQIIGELEFISFESADQAKKLMQSYKFPGAQVGIIIQFQIQQPSQQQQHNQTQIMLNPLTQQQQSTVPDYYSHQPYPQQLILQQPQQAQYPQQYQAQNQQQNINQGSQQLQIQQLPIQSSQLHIQQQQQLSNNNQGLNQLLNNPIFQVPQNATNSLYIDGVPIDATHREVAHVFRPFPGYKAVRLIKKTTQSGREYYYCFADFENSIQSTIALNTLQSYRFDKKHRKCLKIMYANDPQKQQQNSANNPVKSYINKRPTNFNNNTRKIYKKR